MAKSLMVVLRGQLVDGHRRAPRDLDDAGRG
jgi:hypothetical protein